MFEEAKWIAANPHTAWDFLPQDKRPPAPYIVRDFKIGKGLKDATLNIVALGQGAFFVNGERVPDSLLPTYSSNLYKTVFYNTYNITEMLCDGKNRFGVILAGTRYSDTEARAFETVNNVLIAQIDLKYENGKEETVVTDSSWRWHDSPVISSKRRRGDVYDARLEIKKWCCPETDISEWGYTSLWMGAGGKFEPIMCPPHREIAVLAGKEVAPKVFDFGINTSGWARIYVKGK